MGKLRTFMETVRKSFEIGNTLLNIKSSTDSMNRRLTDIADDTKRTVSEIAEIKRHVSGVEEQVCTLDDRMAAMEGQVQDLTDGVEYILPNELGKIKRGIQKELFCTLVGQRHKYVVEQGYATMPEKMQFKDTYDAYHNLGMNGWMDDYLKEVLALPESVEEKERKG